VLRKIWKMVERTSIGKKIKETEPFLHKRTQGKETKEREIEKNRREGNREGEEGEEGERDWSRWARSRTTHF